MLLKIHWTGTESYSRLIERIVPRALKVRKESFYRYIDDKQACYVFNMEYHELIELLQDSTQVHGVILENGQVFVHPDGLVKMVLAMNLETFKKILRHQKDYYLKIDA